MVSIDVLIPALFILAKNLPGAASRNQKKWDHRLRRLHRLIKKTSQINEKFLEVQKGAGSPDLLKSVFKFFFFYQ